MQPDSQMLATSSHKGNLKLLMLFYGGFWKEAEMGY